MAQQFIVGGIYTAVRQRTELASVGSYTDRDGLEKPILDYETTARRVQFEVARETPKFVVTVTGHKWAKHTLDARYVRHASDVLDLDFSDIRYFYGSEILEIASL